MNMYPTGNASLFSSHARRADRAPKAICDCGEEYILGVTGTVDGCDACTKTVRAVNGYALDAPQCTGKDPVRCDDEECPVHGKGGK